MGDTREQIQAAADRGQFFFPVTAAATADERLSLGVEVLMVRLAGEVKAYALDDLRRGPANDRLGGVPLAVLSSAAEAMVAYVARVEGRDLTFAAGDGDTFTDRETGSTWNVGGRAVAGPLTGARLTLVPASRALWFSIAGSNPDIPLYAP